MIVITVGKLFIIIGLYVAFLSSTVGWWRVTAPALILVASVLILTLIK